MDLYSRKLTLNDEESFTELWFGSNLFNLGHSIIALESKQMRFDKWKLDPNKYRFYGFFANNKVIGCYTCSLWPDQYHYSLGGMVLKKNESLRTFKQFQKITTNQILSDMEKLGLYSFFMVSQFRKIHQNMILKNKVWENSKIFTHHENYDIRIVEIVKKNTIAKNKLARDMLGENPWPIDMWIRSGTLKQFVYTSQILPQYLNELQLAE